MKAIILAAGLGRRMQPLTNETHKTLLRIADTTILHRLLEDLRSNGVNDASIVTGYRAKEVREPATSSFPDMNIEFVHNHRYAETNNIFSMALALEGMQIDDDVLLVESDLIVDPSVITQIVNTKYENVALVDRYRAGLDGTVVSINDDGAISQVFPSYLQGESFDFSDKYKTLNIYKFDRTFLQSTFREILSFYSRTIDNSCYYELLLGVLIYMRAATVFAEVVQAPWAEVDDPNDLVSAEFEFNPSSRPSILDEAWGGHWLLPHVDFAFVQNCHFPTPAVVAEIRSQIGLLMTNYPSAQKVLNRKLSYFVQCREANVFLLNGASQAFPLLRTWFNGTRALLPTPTFGEYQRAFPHFSTYPDEVGIDFGQVEEMATDVGVIVFVNPNNPTGTLLPSESILSLARRYPEKSVIVDESFIDFSNQPSVLPDVEREGLGNVIVLKSLGKSLGVPGLRLGFVFTVDPAIQSMLWEDVGIWNINSVAENVIEVILKHRESLALSFELTRADRANFVSQLDALSVVEHVYPSEANFLLVRLDLAREEAGDLARRLLIDSRIRVKDISPRFSDGCGYWRLAVKLPAENDALCNILRACSDYPPARRDLGGDQLISSKA